MNQLVAAPVPRLPRVNRYLAFGAGLTVLALAVALVGLAYSPYAPSKVDLLHRLAAPSPAHLLGPALAICASVIGFNLLGEGLRDRLHVQRSFRDD